MSSVKRLFERHSEGGVGISSAAEWRSFEGDLMGFGLSTPALTRVLGQVWGAARAGGRPVAYADMLAAVAASAPDADADRVVQDLRQDAAALKRFVEYVRSRHKKDSGARKSLESGACGVARAAGRDGTRSVCVCARQRKEARVAADAAPSTHAPPHPPPTPTAPFFPVPAAQAWRTWRTHIARACCICCDWPRARRRPWTCGSVSACWSGPSRRR